MHLKRIAMPRNWQLKKKTNKYIVKSSPGQKLDYSLPILLILRDFLNLAKNTKEVKIILKEGNILLNNKKVISMKSPVGLFDRLYVKKEEKYFTIDLEKQGLNVIEISEKDAQTKPTRIIGKRILNNKRIQINCLDGRNFFYDKEAKIGDSLLIDLKENKIVKLLPLKEHSEAVVLSGEHKGNRGKIEKIEGKRAIVSFKDGKGNVKLENLCVIN